MEQRIADQQRGRRRRTDSGVPHVAAFQQALVENGYAASTLAQRVRVARRVCERLAQQGLTLLALNEQQIDELGLRHSAELSAARSFLRHLRATGVIPVPLREPSTPLEGVARDYEAYLLKERGVCQGSADSYLLTVRRFLREQFGTDAPLEAAQIRAADLSAFMRRHAGQHSLDWAKVMAAALRSFMGFLRWRGDVSTDLAATVPSVAHWRLATLPRWITRPEVERVLQGCEQDSAVGRRNYAILLLLARLGLRAGEVARLTLEDLHWRAGEIAVVGKGGRCDTLPLTEDVGRGLAAYLGHGRARCTTRRVFVTNRAPRRALSNHTISQIAHQAIVRAGIQTVRPGAHTLRHALATDMLRNGAALAEIAEVLRHQNLETTAIYAKVDLDRLRTVAQAWPGGAS